MFQNHLEKLLNPADEGILTDLSNHHTRIPVLDQTIEVKEVKEVIEKQIKPNKSCGPDGITPGAFKLLPGQWIAFLCLLFNIIFVAGYPLIWTSAKLRMLFKKGLHTDCNNYQGISIMNAVAKIYDYVLNNRLMAWYRPCRNNTWKVSINIFFDGNYNCQVRATICTHKCTLTSFKSTLLSSKMI